MISLESEGRRLWSTGRRSFHPELWIFQKASQICIELSSRFIIFPITCAKKLTVRYFLFLFFLQSWNLGHLIAHLARFTFDSLDDDPVEIYERVAHITSLDGEESETTQLMSIFLGGDFNHIYQHTRHLEGIEFELIISYGSYIEFSTEKKNSEKCQSIPTPSLSAICSKTLSRAKRPKFCCHQFIFISYCKVSMFVFYRSNKVHFSKSIILLARKSIIKKCLFERHFVLLNSFSIGRVGIKGTVKCIRWTLFQNSFWTCVESYRKKSYKTTYTV